VTLARAIAAAIALGVFATIATRIGLRMDRESAGFLDTLWFNYRYYTIWTNTLIGLACARIALGRGESPKYLSGLLLSIGIVGAVYHALLAHLNDYTGIDLVIDHMLHTILPLGFAAFWVVFVTKSGLRYRDVLPWLILPLVYCIYAMIRAQFDGVYPYFFLNLAQLGPARTVFNIFGLLCAFALLGSLIVFVERLLVRLHVTR
jgi:hypothetical protein